MKRRMFVLSGFAVILGGAAVRIALSDKYAAVAKILHKRLDYLTLDPQGVAQFAQDIVADGISGSKMILVDAMGPLYTDTQLSPDDKIGATVRHGEDRVVTQYLLSSDLFINGADTSRIVRYRGYYNPMVACAGNPFARPPLDGEA
jgi:hypothetical protein